MELEEIARQLSELKGKDGKVDKEAMDAYMS